MYGINSLETPPDGGHVVPVRRAQATRYRITDATGRQGDLGTVTVEAGDIAEAIGPWYTDYTATELQWLAVVDLQKAAECGAPLRVYARILHLTITEITDHPARLDRQPTHHGAHVRDRHGTVWIRQHLGWLSARTGTRLSWKNLQGRYGPVTTDEETSLLEQLADTSSGWNVAGRGEDQQ